MSKKQRKKHLPAAPSVRAQIITRLGDTVLDARELRGADEPGPRAWPWIAAGLALSAAGLGLFGAELSQDWEGHWASTRAAAVAELPAPTEPGLGLGGFALSLALLGLIPLGVGLRRRADRPARSFTIGEAAAVSVTVPGEGLPDPDAFTLVRADVDGLKLRFGGGFIGAIETSGETASLADLAATGALAEAGGVHRLRLDVGTRCVVTHHDLRFEIEAAETMPLRIGRPEVDRPLWRATAAAGLVLGGALIACESLERAPAPEGAAYVEQQAAELEESRFIRINLEMNEPELPPLPPLTEEEIEAAQIDLNPSAQEGTMGVPKAMRKSGLYAMKGPKAAVPRLARSFEPELAPRRAGILNFMAQSSGRTSSSPYGGAFTAAAPLRGTAPVNDHYADVQERSFIHVGDAPLSTFAVDVDTAAYANVRRFLGDGALPPAAAVRVEEMINYFDYGDPGPSDARPLTVRGEVAAAPWNSANRLVRVAVKAMTIEDEQVPPRNLVFLLDTSGSMHGSDRLSRVLHGLRGLAAELRPEDRMSIVTYAGSSGIALRPTGGDHSEAIVAALDYVRPSGSTNGASGIALAYRLAKSSRIKGGINRVILATDGDFNVGTSSSNELLNLVKREREAGIFLSVLGVGRGNLNDHMMEELADRGDGNYAYLDSDREATRVLVDNASKTLVTVAKDVKIQVEFNPAKVAGYRLIGYENRALADHEFTDDHKDGGEVGAGHAVTALYEIALLGSHEIERHRPALRYQTEELAAAATSAELLTVKVRYKAPDRAQSRELVLRVDDRDADAGQASNAFRLAAAVASFGMLLRDSPHTGDWSLRDVAYLLNHVNLHDPGGDIAELKTLVSQAAVLRGRVSMR